MRVCDHHLAWPVAGQLGHKGSTLKRTAEPTETIDHSLPRQCGRCRGPLPLEQAVVAERRQVIDVPVSVFDVVEHRTLAVHLTRGQMLPYARAAELIADVYGLTVWPATLLAWPANCTGCTSQRATH